MAGISVSNFAGSGFANDNSSAAGVNIFFYYCAAPLNFSALIDNEKWGLDKAGNWFSHTRSATSLMETRTHDNLNRLNQIGGAGSTLVEGTVNELSTVTVNNQPAEFSTLSMRF